jgi:hypothetical protein
MKEAKQSPYNKLVFRETFSDESSVLRNGGTPTNVSFENGVGSFNGTSSIMTNSVLKTPYSFRIRFTPATTITSTSSRQTLALLRYSGIANDFLSIELGNSTSSVTDELICVHGGTGRSSYISTTDSLVAGKQYEIVMVYVGSPNFWDIYLNGLKVNNNTLNTFTVPNISLNFKLGNNIVGTNFYYDGTMDLVEFYDRALTDSEVANLYNDRWNTELSGYGGQVGIDRLPNFTFLNWSNGAGAEINSANQFTATGASAQWIYRSVGGVQGAKYFCSIKGNISLGNMRVSEGTTSPNHKVVSGTFDEQFYFTWETGNPSFLLWAFSEGAVITLEHLVLREVQPNLLLDFNSTNGVLSDKTGKTLTPTDVSIKKTGQKYSASFNGTTSGIDLGLTLNGMTGAYSVCGFIKPYSFGEGNAGHILSNEDRFNLFISTTNNSLGFSRDGSTVIYSANNSIDLHKWTFFYVSSGVNGTTNIYLASLDSAPALSGSADRSAGTPVLSSNNVHIGNRTSDDRAFNGLINSIQIYEGILSLQDITRIYSETKNLIGN